jgi:nucleoside-diphosphate-sugar epimerase
MRVLVLGGTKFIGPFAVRRLVEKGHEVTLFHRGQSHADLPAEVEHIHGDRRQIVEFAGTFKDLAPEVVLDMIPSGEKSGEMLVDLFKRIARRLVAISSGDVYRAYDRLRGIDPGPPDPAPLTEDSPLRDRLYPYRTDTTPPEDFGYHYDKILMERAVMRDPDLPATIIRLPMVYGPGDYQHRLHEYLKRMDDGRPAIILPEDQAAWQGLRGYVEDIGEAIALCVDNESAAGRIYHVADREPLTEQQWIERIARSVGWNGRIVLVPNDQLPESMRHGYDFRQQWSLDSSRIRTELGYSEIVDADVAMARTVEWERANQPEGRTMEYEEEDALLQVVG